jgi:hypothetical protein
MRRFFLFRLAVLLPALSKAIPVDIIDETDSVEVNLTERNSLAARAVNLFGFEGCEGDQKGQILAAWDNMVTMSNKVKGHIDWNEDVSASFV